MNADADLIFVHLGQSCDWSKCTFKTTACLLVIENDVSDALLTSIVVGAISVGCTFFLTWGPMANLLEERIDEILENGSDEWLKISTISLRKRPAEVVANFLFVAAFPNRTDVRYLVIGDRPVEELKEIVAIRI